MGILRFTGDLLKNAIHFHGENLRNCVLAGIVMVSLMMSIATMAVVIELLWFDGIVPPSRLFYLLAVLSAAAIMALFFFDRVRWSKTPRNLRYAWFSWVGVSCCFCGAVLMSINVDAFTTSFISQAFAFTGYSFHTYIRSER